MVIQNNYYIVIFKKNNYYIIGSIYKNITKGSRVWCNNLVN